MSSTNKTANYQLSQFVGNDIPSILNDYNGDMRKIDTAIKEVANAGGDNATAVAELQATVGQHTTEIGGLNSTVNSLNGRVIGIEGKIPANASESNKLITAQDIPEIPSISGLEEDINELKSDVADINAVIPANASASNKLVTIDDVPDPTDISELEADVANIKGVIPNNASVSNKLATMSDIDEGGRKELGFFNRNDYDSKLAFLTAISDAISSANSNFIALDIYANGLFEDPSLHHYFERGSSLSTFVCKCDYYSQAVGNQGFCDYTYYFNLNPRELNWGLNGLLGIRTFYGADFDSDPTPVVPTITTKQFDLSEITRITVYEY